MRPTEKDVLRDLAGSGEGKFAREWGERAAFVREVLALPIPVPTQYLLDAVDSALASDRRAQACRDLYGFHVTERTLRGDRVLSVDEVERLDLRFDHNRGRYVMGHQYRPQRSGRNWLPGRTCLSSGVGVTVRWYEPGPWTAIGRRIGKSESLRRWARAGAQFPRDVRIEFFEPKPLQLTRSAGGLVRASVFGWHVPKDDFDLAVRDANQAISTLVAGCACDL